MQAINRTDVCKSGEIWYNPFHTRSWIFVPAAAGVRIFARDMLRMTPVNAQAGTIEKGQETYGLL